MTTWRSDLKNDTAALDRIAATVGLVRHQPLGSREPDSDFRERILKELKGQS